jgi:cystathionine gamma-lyase
LKVKFGNLIKGLVESVLMTHKEVPIEVREKLGILDNLVRMSVGLEDVVDLIEDL